MLSVGIVSAYAAEEDDAAEISAEADEAPADVAADVTEAEEGADVTDTEAAETEADATEVAETGASATESANSGSVGVWKVSAFASDQYSDEEKIIYQTATKGITAALYLPVQVIATRTDDSGTYYVYLSSVTELSNILDSLRWEITTIFVDKQGNTSMLKTVVLDPGDAKTTDKAPDDWTVTATAPSADDLGVFSTALRNALADYKDVKLDYIAELAYQIDETGEKKCLLCYGTKDSKTNLYVVEVHDDFIGDAEITKVSPFDIDAYAGTSSNGGGKVDPNGSNTSSKSPQTGNSGVVVVLALMAVMGLLGVCVSTKQIAKKKD